MQQMRSGATIVVLLLVASAVGIAGAAQGVGWRYESFVGMVSETGPATVRFVHASPDAPAVDVWFDGVRLVRDLGYGGWTPYVRVPTGSHMVKVVPAGATAPVVMEATVELKSLTGYTVVVAGTADALQPVALKDAALATRSTSNVRFVHAVPDAPAVDVASPGRGPLLGNVSFGEATGYALVPRGSYALDVRPAGGEDVVLSIPRVVFRGGGSYTIVAFGSLADGSLHAMLLEDARPRR